MADSSGQVVPEEELQIMETENVSNDTEGGAEGPIKEAKSVSKPTEVEISKNAGNAVEENGHQESPNGKKSPRNFQKLDQNKMSRSTSHKFSKSSPSEKKGSSDVWSRITGSDGTENLPGYALPTVAFQLRVSLCHSADGLTDQCLPVCQRYRSDSPNALSNFIKEQRSKSAENRRNQMEKMIELSQPTSRRSKFNATIPTSASNHTSASDSSTPHSGRSSKSPGKSLNKKSSLDDSLIGRKSKPKKDTSGVHSTPDGKIPMKKLKKKTSSLDVLAMPRSKEPRQPSASRQSPVKSLPSNSAKDTHSRDSSVHQPKVAKPKADSTVKQNGSPEKNKDKKPKDLKEKKKVESPDTPGKPENENKKETDEYKAKLAEKRKQARERAEKEAEEERKKQEEQRAVEEEQKRREEEEERKREEEELKLVEESRKAEEERLQKMIEEEEERKRREAEKLEKEQQAKKEQEMKAKAEAEKLEQERLLKIKKDEEEKLERKKRLENIMKRVKPDEASDRKGSISSAVTNGVPESQASQDSAPVAKDNTRDAPLTNNAETEETAEMEETNAEDKPAKDSASDVETGETGPENHGIGLESSNATGVEETPTESF